MTLSRFFDKIAGIVHAGGIHSGVDNSHVNTHDVLRVDGRFLRCFDSDHEVEHLILSDKVTLSPDPFKWYLPMVMGMRTLP